MSFLYLLIALFASSLGSIVLAGLFVLLKKNDIEKISLYLIYFAGGTLLGASLLVMIPKTLELLSVDLTFNLILIGVLFFFLMEKFILWRTCYNKGCERQINAMAPMILIGDAFHNAIDGIVIAASFLISPKIGFFVTFSVILHEIPQELGDFGILIKSGLSKKKAILYNLISGSTAIFMGILAFFFLDKLQILIPYALAFSASSFLYIALADLIPQMHKKTLLKDSIIQFLLIDLGVLLIFCLVKN